jgi:hypothetical protein
MYTAVIAAAFRQQLQESSAYVSAGCYLFVSQKEVSLTEHHNKNCTAHWNGPCGCGHHQLHQQLHKRVLQLLLINCSSAGRAVALEAEVAAVPSAETAASSSSSSLPSADLQLFIDNDYELQVGIACALLIIIIIVVERGIESSRVGPVTMLDVMSHPI